MHSNQNENKTLFFNLVDLQVAQRSRTSARRTCARTEACASASGTPTAATAPLVMEARAANKVSARSRCKLEDGGVVGVGVWGYEAELHTAG